MTVLCNGLCDTGAHTPMLSSNSLQGSVVVLAAEPICICGVDVAAPPQDRMTKAQNLHDLKRIFNKQFSSVEVWKAL